MKLNDSLDFSVIKQQQKYSKIYSKMKAGRN